jgi:hypothetical protein
MVVNLNDRWVVTVRPCFDSPRTHPPKIVSKVAGFSVRLGRRYSGAMLGSLTPPDTRVGVLGYAGKRGDVRKPVRISVFANRRINSNTYGPMKIDIRKYEPEGDIEYTDPHLYFRISFFYLLYPIDNITLFTIIDIRNVSVYRRISIYIVWLQLMYFTT